MHSKRTSSQIKPVRFHTVLLVLFLSLMAVFLSSSILAGAEEAGDPPGLPLVPLDATVTDEAGLKSQIASSPDGVNNIITLGNDIFLTSTLEIPSSKVITLTAADGIRLVGPNGQDTVKLSCGPHFLIFPIVPCELTLTGGLVITHNSGALGRGVSIDPGCVFNMTGGKITGNTNNGTATFGNGGGGVANYGGTFTMSGGEISGNSDPATMLGGGGVYNDGTGAIVPAYWGTFTMTGGIITNNTTSWYGGGVSNHTNSTVSISGTAEISHNTAYQGAGIYSYIGNLSIAGGDISDNVASNGGGGLHVSAGSFSLSNGIISNNSTTTGSGGGIYFAGGSPTMTGGTISLNQANGSGGGVVVAAGASFSMDNGAIENNTATGATGSGGGVYVTSTTGVIPISTFYLSGSAIISGNNASRQGGGILNSGGSLDISGNATISGNYANTSGGGIQNTGGPFVMDGGEISGNSTNNGDGNGLYLSNSPSCVIEGGARIVNNNSSCDW
ncbi:MAG: hypothetical protein FWF91_08460, partial [Coriobacteriia bacterium]|nr:hypothetical protein [Coriobacteriia bacterium]